jgi:hypothetical protein
MIAGFEFVDGGRRYACKVEPLRATREDWWWFSVSSEAHQRFAPFRATEADTPESVRLRVTAYYEEMLARRLLPPVTQWRRGGRPKTDAVPAVTPGVAEVATPES